MQKSWHWITRGAEFLMGMAMLAMFATFILQIVIRYTARADWIAEAMPFLEPSRYGWTLEFCLALWVWIVFFGNATIVRDRDHVTFDILYTSVRPAPAGSSPSPPPWLSPWPFWLRSSRHGTSSISCASSRRRR